MGKFVFLALVLQICLTFCRTESVKFDWVHFNKSGGTFTNADEGKKTVADYLNRYASYSFWGSPSLNNSQCKIDMEAILQEANGLNFWALKSKYIIILSFIKALF